MSDQGAGNVVPTGDEHVLLQNDEGAWIGEATTQQIADLAGPGGGAGITVSDTDPGATGAGSGWLLTDAAGVPLAFFIRNNADDGWLSDAALPAGALESTVELADDLEVGEASGTFARMHVFPLAIDGGYVTAYQCKFEGDVYPRLVIVSDGSFYVGDGTFNPLQTGSGFNACGLLPDGSGGLVLVSDGVRFELPTSGDAELQAASLTLRLAGAPVRVFMNSGDPNGLVTALQSGDLVIDHSSPALWQAPGAGTVWSQVGAILRQPTLPADGDLNDSDVAFALDDTPGATALLVKAKDSAGTVRTGSLALG